MWPSKFGKHWLTIGIEFLCIYHSNFYSFYYDSMNCEPPKMNHLICNNSQTHLTPEFIFKALFKSWRFEENILAHMQLEQSLMEKL